jgi:hypothetical protein
MRSRPDGAHDLRLTWHFPALAGECKKLYRVLDFSDFSA